MLELACPGLIIMVCLAIISFLIVKGLVIHFKKRRVIREHYKTIINSAMDEETW